MRYTFLRDSKTVSGIAQQSKPRAFKRLKRIDALWGYAFITPQLMGFLIFVIGPLIAVFVFSLQEFNILANKRTFVGFGNYSQMFLEDSLFIKTLLNSLVFTVGLVPINIALALTLSIVLSQNMPGKIFFRMIFFAPVLTSAVAWAIVWRFLLQGENGIVNQYLIFFGIRGPNWLREVGWAMLSVIVVRVIKNVGLNMIIFLAALSNIPVQYVEAARIDGANRWVIFQKITLPFLAPTSLMVVIITVIGSLQVFDHILLLTAGGPQHSTLVLVYYIYYQAFEFFEVGYASGAAVILFVLALVFTLVQWLLRRKFVFQEV